MFGCTKMDKKSVNIDNEYNFGIRKNEKLKFLILLNDDDMSKKDYLCKKSRKSIILKYKKFLSGDLDIINFNNIEDDNIISKYIIEDNPLQNELYMKLPDKNIYVLSNKYALKYLLLKQNELKNIFIFLGAKSIKWSIIKENNKTSSIDSNLSVNINEIDLCEGFSIENKNLNYNKELNIMTFEYDENIINNIDFELFSNNKFYFLPKEYEWQNIIIRRLQNNLIYDKYIYKYTNNIYFKTSLVSKLKMIDVNFNYSTDELNNLEIHYEIEYYPINKKSVDEEPNNILDENLK
jgi:hypothetical protein